MRVSRKYSPFSLGQARSDHRARIKNRLALVNSDLRRTDLDLERSLARLPSISYPGHPNGPPETLEHSSVRERVERPAQSGHLDRARPGHPYQHQCPSDGRNSPGHDVKLHLILPAVIDREQARRRTRRWLTQPQHGHLPPRAVERRACRIGRTSVADARRQHDHHARRVQRAGAGRRQFAALRGRYPALALTACLPCANCIVSPVGRFRLVLDSPSTRKRPPLRCHVAAHKLEPRRRPR